MDTSEDIDLNVKEIFLTGLTEEEMKTKVKEIIKNSEYLIFMKGTPTSPMCGFSRFAIEILKFYQIPHLNFVNVLSDS